MEPSNPTDHSAVPEPATLPPEVEAELRRRLSAEPPTAPAAPALPPAPHSPSPSVPAPGARLHPGNADRLRRLGPIGVLLATLLKYLPLAAKFGLIALKTGGTMLLSMGVYAHIFGFGWPFAVVFVLCILVHEMGHVFVAWRMGVPVSAPIFIPGMGALIMLKRDARSAWDGALIGIGGPVAGTLAGLVCLVIGQTTGSRLMLAAASITFFLNLFNLAPIYPLDGGRIIAAVSPRIWLVGIVGMIIAFATGRIQNPLILLLLILSAPRLWRGLTTGDVTPAGGVPTTPRQRMVMGVSYVSLGGLLLWLMANTPMAR